MGTRNKLTDLNNHLFEQLERLNDEDLTDDQLDREIKRAKSMTEIADAIIENANIALKAEQTRLEYGLKPKEIHPLLANNEQV